MDLIMIHGPPASGKYTVAKELMKREGYKLLHNHSTIDLLSPVLEKTDGFWKTCWEIRHIIVKEAITQGCRCLVMTLAFKGTENERKYISEITDTVKRQGKVHTFKLTCPLEELERRVVSERRSEHGKMTDIQTLHDWLTDYNDVKIDDDALINNSTMSPEDTAKEIIKLSNNQP